MNDGVVVLGTHTPSLEAADWAIVGQQVKHHSDSMMLYSSIRFTSGFCLFCFQGSGWLMVGAK